MSIDYHQEIERINDLPDALRLLEQGPDLSQDTHSEYPEAAQYLSAISGYLVDYAREHDLSSTELRHICGVVLGALFYE
ncbi:hypothetical protein [Sulfitobacter mediterraneus]|uniref:hypothetical protein n=1 Tax=Sulfitobacter mediterraneus TaxID=83219 RepID=UPI0021A6E5ED|nr:hypothetical protein [Sulfitobacter mediterraneus]UWR10621.1 hypothetical protein K3753_15410 [Sulfitobacter mediterraneus]